MATTATTTGNTDTPVDHATPPPSPKTSTRPQRIEKVYVLYGSQTGNSEQHAKELCHQVSTKLSPSAIRTLADSSSSSTTTTTDVIVEPVHMQLDDFLELEKCTWTRLVVIITSSYGVGQAPLGCYRFRELCDAWYNQYSDEPTDTTTTTTTTTTSSGKHILSGVCFALCGLGDSKYTTFFQNPRRIDAALQAVGAIRVGPLGQADASGTGHDLQGKVVERWMDEIWPYLAQVVATEPPPDLEDRLQAMQLATIQVCRQINPDFVVHDPSSSSGGMMKLYYYYYYHGLAILVALLSVMVYYSFYTPK